MTNACKKCGKKLDKEDYSLDWRSNYCNNCVDVFDIAIEHGAIVIRRCNQHDNDLYPYEISSKNIKSEADIGMNQVNAIKRAKELAKEQNDKILFNNGSHGSMWFLEDYLIAHPKIKEDVERPGFFSKLLEIKKDKVK